MSLRQDTKFLLPPEASMGLQSLFQARGLEGLELAALLAGYPNSAGDFLVDTVAVPMQLGEPVEYGCNLVIPGSELTRLGEEVRSLDRMLCGQIHSHPSEAFHSRADDENLFARFNGGISIVVPSFGKFPVIGPRTVVFRFDSGRSEWIQARRPTDVITIGPEIEVNWLA